MSIVRSVLRWLRGLFLGTQPPAPRGVKKLGLVVGVNDYPGTNQDLRGCVNDARVICQLAADTYGFAVTALYNKRATPRAVTTALRKLVSSLQAGDTGFWSVSSHGTYVADRGQHDEVDGRDEALYLWGRDFKRSILVDDQIRGILRGLKAGVHFFVVTDTCHSGTMTRALHTLDTSVETPLAPRIKFVPPPRMQSEELAAPVTQRFACPEEGMTHVLLTGCSATEYSYDTVFGGQANGAASHWLETILRTDPDITYNQMHRRLRARLPSPQCPQSPQLEGPAAMKATKVFGGVK